MTPGEFIRKWQPVALTERATAQSHFLDLCKLLGHDDPIGADPRGEWFAFEKGVTKTGGGDGFADVWKRGHFAWEYKKKKRDLDAALDQLVRYAAALENPPLQVACDTDRFLIRTAWTNAVPKTYEIALDDLADPARLDILRAVFFDPARLKPDTTRAAVTREAADKFVTIAERLQGRGTPEAVAHFVNQLVFCFFANSVKLLPEGFFPKLLKRAAERPDRAKGYFDRLFAAMETGGEFDLTDIAWFNGGLFDGRRALPLESGDVGLLQAAAGLDWSQIDPTIFGTLFERFLDPDKRKQIGAHYTDPDKIVMLVEPVILRPLAREWEAAKAEIEALLAGAAKPPMRARPRRRMSPREAAEEVRSRFLERLRTVSILDPACGSGNFLYLALQGVKDLENRANLECEALGLPPRALQVGPEILHGIEISAVAAELARTTIWIGEIQWRRRNGYYSDPPPILRKLDNIECRDALILPRAAGEGDHPPPLAATGADGSQQRLRPMAVDGGGGGSKGAAASRVFPTCDSMSRHRQQPMSVAAPSTAAACPRAGRRPDPGGGPPPPLRGGGSQGATWRESPWPAAEFIVGNPPFLGGKLMRAGLGDDTVEALFAVYAGRVPPEADLVAYWFEKARAEIATGRARRAGLVATNSIRGGASRRVLERVAADAALFEAWSDEPWIVEGAAVRVSLVCFGAGEETPRLDGLPVPAIHSDLTSAEIDLTRAKRLRENADTAFQGPVLVGEFNIPGEIARLWLRLPLNPNGRPNSDVLYPLRNGKDLNSRARDAWVISFATMTQSEAALYEAPFEHVFEHVRPYRLTNKRLRRRELWWRHGDLAPKMWGRIDPICRYIAGSQVSKHRTWSWVSLLIWPHQTVIAIARDDDTTFGLLHSRFHEAWSLRLGTSLEDRPRYTPTTTFETFPFPEGLTPDLPAADYADDPRAVRIAAAAKRLDELRRAWLNPPDLVETVPEATPTAAPGEEPVRYPDRVLPVSAAAAAELKTRTLTNLYNLRPQWLAEAHAALDAAVAAAYGWPQDIAAEDALARLLALNLARAAP